MSIPTISLNKTECNKIIEDGYNGRFISSKSVKILKNIMEEFVLNSQLIRQMSGASRQYVIDKYEQKQLLNEALRAYKKNVNDV